MRSLILLVAPLLVALPASAVVIEVGGTPICGPTLGSFGCSVLTGHVVIDEPVTSEPVVVVIPFILGLQIELFDGDVENDIWTTELGVSGPVSLPLFIEVVIDFLDASGEPITPASLESGAFGNRYRTSGAGLSSFSVGFRAQELDGLVFHGIRLTMTGSGARTWDTLERVVLWNIDPTSSVGLSVPEPGTRSLLVALALGGVLLVAGRSSRVRGAS